MTQPNRSGTFSYMKHNLTLETTIEDIIGQQYEVTAEIKAKTYLDREEGGIFIDECDISNIVIKGDCGTYNLKMAEEMPDIFNQDQVRKLYIDAEEAVMKDIECQTDSRHEYSNDN